ncbi:MAG: hypothetical protein GY943_04035 [Chloroflexi bacterium]|nr:hypothetical protein [Chloroflexota bacterium]
MLALPAKRIGYYATATAVSLILILIVATSFKKYPLFAPDSDVARASEWTAVTNNAQTYTFILPEDWVWQETETGNFTGFGIEREAVETAVSLFTAIDKNSEIVLIAHANDGSDTLGFVVVAQSSRMRTLTPEQLISYLTENSTSILKAEVISKFYGEHANLYTELTQPDNQALLCHQRYTTTSITSYIIASCSPRNQFGSYGNDLENIANSFQVLLRN